MEFQTQMRAHALYTAKFLSLTIFFSQDTFSLSLYIYIYEHTHTRARKLQYNNYFSQPPFLFSQYTFYLTHHGHILSSYTSLTNIQKHSHISPSLSYTHTHVLSLSLTLNCTKKMGFKKNSMKEPNNDFGTNRIPTEIQKLTKQYNCNSENCRNSTEF